jgi:hypothetical protein
MKGFDFEILLFLKRKLMAFEWILKRISSRRFLSRIKGYDFRALKCPKTPSGKACRLFNS